MIKGGIIFLDLDYVNNRKISKKVSIVLREKHFSKLLLKAIKISKQPIIEKERS